MSTISLGAFDHGGDIYSRAVRLDFSACVNPFGMPPAARQALMRSIDFLPAYPDVRCRRLKEAIHQVEKVPHNFIVCTAGATDALARCCIALSPRKALVVSPSFTEYERTLNAFHARTVCYPLSAEDDFAFGDDILSYLTPDLDVAFLSSPNNPTGTVIPPDLLESILTVALRNRVRVVLDESFVALSHEQSAVGLARRFKNLTVVKALSKAYGLAGLRCGYLICGDVRFATRLSQAGQEWSVSVPAQAAGEAALKSPTFISRSRDEVDTQRLYLAKGLQDLGFRVVPSAANFILFQNFAPVSLYDALLDDGVLIRRCENFDGLDGSWFRVAVLKHHEDEILLEAIERVLGPEKHERVAK